MKQHYTHFKMLIVVISILVSTAIWAQKSITTSDGLKFLSYSSNNAVELSGYEGTDTTIQIPTTITYEDSNLSVTGISWTDANTSVTTLDLSLFNENNYVSGQGNVTAYTLLYGADLSGVANLKTIYVDYDTYTQYGSSVDDIDCSFAETANVSLAFNPDYEVSGNLRYMVANYTNVSEVIIVGFEGLSEGAEVMIPEKIDDKSVYGIELIRNSDDQLKLISKMYFEGMLRDQRGESGFYVDGISADNAPNLVVVFSNITDYETYQSDPFSGLPCTYNVETMTDGVQYAVAYDVDFDEEQNMYVAADIYYIMVGFAPSDETVTTATLLSEINGKEVTGVISSNDYAKMKTLIVEGDYSQYFDDSYIPFSDLDLLYCNSIESANSFYNNRVARKVYFTENDVIYNYYVSSGNDSKYIEVVGITSTATSATIPEYIEFKVATTGPENVEISRIYISQENKNLQELTIVPILDTDTTCLHYFFPNLTTLNAKYYLNIENWKNSEKFLQLYGDELEVKYIGETTESGDILLGDYDEYNQIWIGFSDAAEGYVEVSNITDEGGEMNFMYVGYLESSEKVTHLTVSLLDCTVYDGAFSKLTTLEGIYFKETLQYGDPEGQFGENVNIFADDISNFEDAYANAGYNLYSTTISNYIVDESDDYSLNGIVIDGSFADGVTVNGYDGTLSGIDLSDAKIKYHGWELDINTIEKLYTTTGSESTLKLITLPCDNVWTNGQALTNSNTPTAVEGESTISLVLSCDNIMDFSNSRNLLDAAALIFVPSKFIDRYQAANADYSDKFVDIALIQSEEEGIVYDAETNTLQVEISAETDLNQLADIVNSGAGIIENVLLKLDGDIDLTSEDSSQEWGTIGTSEVPFNGTFDGQGFTITMSTDEATAVASTLFGTIGDEGIVENLNVEGLNYEADAETDGVNQIGDGETETKTYYPLLAATNNGRISNIVVTGSVQIEETDEATAVACIVANNDENGELDHVVGYFENNDEGNKRCILVSQNVGVGRNAGKASKTCSNTKAAASKKLTIGDATPLDVDDDIRYYTNDEMASGEPAYWLNFKGKGYTGEYTREWSAGKNYPIIADANNKPAVKLVYEIDGATSEEVGLTTPKYYANEGSTISLKTLLAPNQVIVNGEELTSNISTDMEFVLSGIANTDGTIKIELKYITTAIEQIDTTSPTKISANGRQITISNAADEQFSIFDIRGAEVMNGQIETNVKQLLMPEIGVYIVKVGNTIQKVVVR